MGFRKAAGFNGPIGMTLRNQHERPEDPFFFFFFFGDHLILTEKTVRISVKTFFLDIT